MDKEGKDGNGWFLEGYCRRGGALGGSLHQDPARSTPPIPDLAPATQLGALADGDDLARVIAIHLTRGQNRLIWACRSAEQAVDRFLAKRAIPHSPRKASSARSTRWARSSPEG